MQESIQSFEKQLKNKLEYKASSKISPDTFLYKSFKFFDLFNNGYLTRQDFFKAIAKCGVVVDTHDMDRLYQHYDTHKDGNIYYKEFIQNLLFLDSDENSLKMSQSQVSQGKRYQESNPEQKQVEETQNFEKSRKTQQNNSLRDSNINRIYKECETFTQVSQSIKKNLRQNGLSGLLSLAVDLKSVDSIKSHKINMPRLSQLLPFLSQKALLILINEFNPNPRQEINYAELIYSLKGQLHSQHEQVIQKAFQVLDVRQEREVEIQRVIAAFKHLQYRQQFQRAIQLYQTFQGIDDGVFTDEDFADFFGFLAFSFSDSHQFKYFMQKAYLNFDAQSTNSQRSARSREFRNESQVIKKPTAQIQSDFRKNKQIIQSPIKQSIIQQQQSPINRPVSQKSSQRSMQQDNKSSTTSFYVKEVGMIISRIKKRLASKGAKGYLIFQKALKLVDTDDDGLVTLDQLKKVVKDQKIDITNNQTNLFFDVFDPQSTQFISYDELVHTLKGQMPEKRRNYFQRVWASIKLNEQSTSFSSIKHNLNFRGHPDIQTGRRSDDQIFRQIQDTILLIQQLNQSARSQTISKKEFEQYFQNLSLSISEDQLLESILQNFWKMKSNVNINQMYAGSRKLFDAGMNNYLLDHHRYAVKGGSISSNAPFGTSSEPTSYFTQHGKL